jgi:hypothetical protein
MIMCGTLIVARSFSHHFLSRDCLKQRAPSKTQMGAGEHKQVSGMI